MKRILAIVLVSIAMLTPWKARATALFFDDFNRADQPLGAPNWDVSNSLGLPAAQITSQEACGDDHGFGKWVRTIASTDVGVSFSWETADADEFEIFAAAATTGGDFYVIGCGGGSGTCTPTIKDVNTGSPKLQGSPVTLQTGHTYGIYAEFTTTQLSLTLYDGVTVLAQLTQPSGANFRQFGIITGRTVNNKLTCADNFLIENLAPPSCTDLIQNGTETDIDCGGSCSACVPSSCSDGIQNGGETGVDCGGSCAACATSGCSSAPLAGCRAALKSSLKVTANSAARDKNKIGWSWAMGQDTSFAEIGDPTAASDYQFCIYADGNRWLEASVPAAGTCNAKDCWTAKPEKSYAYKDKAGANGGLTAIKLNSGVDGKTKLSVKGKGSNLSDMTLPVSAPLKAQLQNVESGLCWEATFAAEDLTVDADKGKLKGSFKP